MIVQAKSHHLLEAMFIYKACVQEMNERGLFNWNTAYPSLSMVKNDIEAENLFIYQHNLTSIGVVCLNNEEPEEYRELNWNYSEPCLYVHRLAVHPEWRNMKIAEKMMDFSLKFAREKKYKSIRLDAITKNPQAIRLYEKCGYREVGNIHFPYQKDEFRCMELEI